MSNEPFDQWCILEIMGHRRMGCHVREITIAGVGMLRCEIPKGDGFVTQIYPPSAIYCLTPTTEELARRFAENHFTPPVHRYELPAETASNRSGATNDDYVEEGDF